VKCGQRRREPGRRRALSRAAAYSMVA